ncbi:ABC transporter permease [Micromonospora sp. NPDC007271]|uniref:ABC transporter permease n=1 Tax=Micromonospora sp. NPDC007271 TaxID=3154587 RepID=UPI0033EBF686
MVATRSAQQAPAQPAATAVVAPRPHTPRRALLARYFAVVALAAIFVFFSLTTEVFFSGANFLSVIEQAALLAIVATAMGVVIRSGGIDLSVGVALDIGALVCVHMVDAGYIISLSVVMGLLAGAVMGLCNGLVITYLKVSPFLTTLSMLFIGTSIQKVATGGGSPIYLPPASVPEEFSAFGRGHLLGIPAPTLFAVAILIIGWVLLERLRVGRSLTAVGAQPAAAVLSGVPARRVTMLAYVFSGLVCALGGIVLASRTSAYVPLSGDYYTLDAIGAVFIGTTLHKESRPNVPGTLLGVLIFTVLGNGLNLIGLSFYWQGLARGAVLLLVLGISVTLSKRRSVLQPRRVSTSAS